MTVTDPWTHTTATAGVHPEATPEVVRPAKGDVYLGVFQGNPRPLDGCRPLRVAMNFFLVETRRVVVLEMDVPTFAGVCEMRDRYGLENWIFKISIPNDETCTEARVAAVRELSSEEHEQIGKARVYNLATHVSPDEDADVTKPVTGPLAPGVLASITPRLRQLPRDLLDEFLQRFSVFRIRDIPAEREAEVLDTLNMLEARARPHDPVDPFA